MTSWFVQPRVIGLFLFLPTFIILLIAISLTPNPAGMGTHQQLGLNPCSFWLLFGFPCPMCGMTTAFTLLAHFQFVLAFQTQPFGVVLFVLMMAILGIGAADVITGKGFYKTAFRWFVEREVFFSRSLMVGLLLGWIYKIWKMGTFPW